MIVKICGITEAGDALAAAEAGATAVGFVFYAGSPRCVGPAQAARIAANLPPNVWRVGVFVNEPAARIQQVVTEAGLDIAQLYGVCGIPGGLRIWRNVRVSPGFRPAMIEDDTAEALLFETASPAHYGGTGETFDWKLARGVRGRFLIAGGLDEHNVREAIEAARPWGVDASSRLEVAPGRKDRRRVRAFVEAALAVAREVA